MNFKEDTETTCVVFVLQTRPFLCLHTFYSVIFKTLNLLNLKVRLSFQNYHKKTHII